MRVRRFLAGTFVLLAVVPLGAHHSFAAFDRKKEITVTGVVKEVQWNNPHAWIQVTVTAPKGKQTESGVECGRPHMLPRTGWKRTTLKTGDKVTAVGNPLKDGRTN